jgi:hypothetical protein
MSTLLLSVDDSTQLKVGLVSGMINITFQKRWLWTEFFFFKMG